jgi:hypothetical protein
MQSAMCYSVDLSTVCGLLIFYTIQKSVVDVKLLPLILEDFELLI